MITSASDTAAIVDLIQRTAMLLDEEKFEAWVELFDARGTYELSAYSSEIRRWMTWQLSEPRCAREKCSRTSMSMCVNRLGGGTWWEFRWCRWMASMRQVTSHFSLFRTSPEGQSSLFMVGGYQDQLIKHAGVWVYAKHKVICDTRMLDSFTHIPV